MADNVIQVEIEFADGTKGFAALKASAFKAGEEAGQNVATAFANGSRRLLKIAAGLGAAIGTAIFSREAIRAAAEQEAAFNRFSLALVSSGQFTRDFANEFNNFASSIQRTTKFQDDAVLSGAALLQQIGRLRQDQLIPATKAATDLASALQIDLDSAFTLIGKAAQGNVSAFQRLGIEIQKGKTDAETFSNTLKKLSDNFSGAATAEVKTFSGAFILLKNTFGDLLETLGDIIVKNPAIIGLFTGLGKVIANLTQSINVTSLSNGLTFLIQGFLSFAQAVTNYAIKPLLFLFDVGKIVFNGIKIGIQSIIAAVGTLGAALGGVLNSVGIVSDSTLQSLTTFKDSATEQLTAFTNELNTSFANIGQSTAIADNISNQIGIIKTAIDEAILSSQNAAQTLPANFKIAQEKMSESAKKAEFDIKSALGQGISNTIQTTVKALVQGKNGFEAFAKGVLSTVGDLAIQLGTFFIINGIGIEALKALGGTGAIAAGAALVALGSLMKAIGGGAEGLGVTSTSGGGVAPAISDGGTTAVPDQSGDVEAQKPKTEVNINIEGNILDRRESGLAIAEILNEYFDTNDGAFAKA